jgi:hypothetical protein
MRHCTLAASPQTPDFQPLLYRYLSRRLGRKGQPKNQTIKLPPSLFILFTSTITTSSPSLWLTHPAGKRYMEKLRNIPISEYQEGQLACLPL